MDTPKAGGASQAPKPVLDPASVRAVTPLRSRGRQDEVHMPWFELTVQEGVGGGKRSTGKSNRGKLR